MTLRPQYHFRQTPDGTLIWDIRKLVDLLSHAPVFDLQIGTIRELDEPYWFRATSQQPTCRAIAEHMAQVSAADHSFPIILCAEGRIMDGMHRVVKAFLDGRDTIKAKQFTQTPPHDFKDMRPDELKYS